jgi:citrate synthase
MGSVGLGSQDWVSALTETTPDGIHIRGYDLLDLVGTTSFSSVVYLLYAGELPAPAAARLLDALMVASVDHGPGTPSVLAARTVISGGGSFQAGAAAGLLAMGQFHAAAVGDAMSAISEVADRAAAGSDYRGAADDLVAARRRDGRRLSGFGHRQHTERDPRVDRLFDMARELGVEGSYIDATIAIEGALEAATGRRLPINIDGVYAAILAELDFPVELANAVFIASRMVGVMAHVAEEINSMPPMRRIDPVAHTYGGPPRRPFPPGGSA